MDRGESTQFKLADRPYTKFYNCFFTLRVHVSLNGQTAEIGVSDKNVLQLGSRYPKASVSFDSLIGLVDAVVRHHGVSGVRHGWYENEAPLFELTVKPGDDLSKLLHTVEQLQTKLAVKMEADFSRGPDSSSSPLSVNVHTELYMVTPKAVNSSAVNNTVHLDLVTDDNLLSCLDLWRDSVVFEFDAAFTALRTKPILEGDEEFEPGLINRELNNIADWYSLGVNLGLSTDDLDIIRCDVRIEGVMQCRLTMLTQWYNGYANASWSDLISALVLTDKRRLAHKLARKYSVVSPPMHVKSPPAPIYSTQTNEPSFSTQLQEELHGKVEELRRRLGEKDTEMEDKERTIRESNSRKETMSKEQDLLTLELKLNEEKNVKLQKEKKKLERKLQSKGVELRLLESAQYDSKWKGEVGHLQEMIEEKVEKIKFLRERLKTVEKDLESERVISQDLNNKMSCLEMEVREKTAEVHRREIEVMKMKYEIKDLRSELDRLKQLRSANSSQEELLKEFQHQLSVMKRESEAKSSKIDQYKATILQKEAEMQKLQEKLQQQLASEQQCSSRLQEEREREVTAEFLELQTQLSQAEQAKRWAEGQLAATQLHITKLKEREDELWRLRQATEKKMPPPIKPRVKRREEEHFPVEPPAVIPRSSVGTYCTIMKKPRVAPRPSVRRRKCPSSELHPGTRLQWKKCADAPICFYQARAVVVGEKVYVGGQYRENTDDDDHQVYQYNHSENTWDILSLCPVESVTLATFKGRLIAVGGFADTCPTNKVYTYTEAVDRWDDELIPPMPTPRFSLSVATTSSMIIAAGGCISSYDCCATVEVYSMVSLQWHAADPLPAPCKSMNSAIIDNTCYFLCGYTKRDTLIRGDFFCASMVSLMEKIDRPTPHSESVWKCLPHTPWTHASSAAVSLRGTLVVVRALDGVTAVHAFLNNVWVRLSNADFQEELSGYFTASLSPDTVIVFGSMGQSSDPHAAYIGTVVDQ